MITRRKFFQSAVSMAAALYLPVAKAAEVLKGKIGLRMLNDRPVNAEALPHSLDDEVTPTAKFFVRNNGLPPENVNPEEWRLTIDGESAERELVLSIKDLKTRYQQHDLQLTVECGGNGRSEFNPRVPGNQWSLGAVGCPLWHGVRLRDVLQDAGIKPDAVYIGYRGADTHLSRDPNKAAISRGVPIEKALADDALITWGMNGGDLHPLNGHPLRLAIAGWPGSVSGKWLTRISIRNQVHDGAKMGGKSYRMPKNPVAPGESVADADMAIIEAMPVKSLITAPRTGVQHAADKPLEIRGHAWVGDDEIAEVQVSSDFGQTWQTSKLRQPVNAGAWQHFSTTVSFPKAGYYEVWAKATDASGLSQPMVLPGWNPKGYLNNACHRIAVHVA